jgi:hypothetical protein
MMHSPTANHDAATLPEESAPKAMHGAERAYRGLTIAAMLALLCSTLWLFR